MKLARTGLIAAAILAVSSVAFAQTPDFSGTWTPDAPAMAPAAPAGGGQGGGGGARGGGMGGPMTVKQTATDLTIERSMGENKMVATYKLDGTESVNKQMGRGGEIETKSTAKWDGSKLVISTQRPGQDGAMMTQVQTWSLEAGNLTIESPGRDGTPTKRVYKKTT
ncbi:MAG: hypothetical protein ABI039_01900 [Vicinamibacterales bacterium]